MQDTVVVACKLRTGLNIGGNLVNGYFHAPGEQAPEGIRGYALTPAFPRKVWDYWFEINKDSDLVLKGFIVAGDTVEDVKASIFRFVGARSPPIFGSKPYSSGQ